MYLTNAQVEIVSINGQLILSQVLTSDFIEIPEYIASGLYFVSVTIEDQKTTKKIIVGN